MTDEKPRVQTTERSFHIIESLQQKGSAGISELAREVGLSKAAVYKHVQTLTRLGYLVRDGNEYYLSNRFLRLGEHARERLPMAIIREVITDLAATTGHTANFISFETNKGVYTLCIDSSGGVDAGIAEGDVAPLHATAGGKAILAFLPGEKRNEFLATTDLPEYTEKTISDSHELEQELQSIRDQRIAFDREEYIDGHQCVASPVIGTDNEPVGAVSVTGAISYMSGKRLEEDVTGLVTSAAKSIENDLLSS